MPARAAAWLAALVLLGATPAAAGSQSSNSFANCSNGHCTRMERYETELGGFRQGWTHIDRWDERQRRRGWDERRWRGGDRYYYADPYRHYAPRRHRRGGDRDD